jgi:hypothetical protein
MKTQEELYALAKVGDKVRIFVEDSTPCGRQAITTEEARIIGKYPHTKSCGLNFSFVFGWKSEGIGYPNAGVDIREPVSNIAEYTHIYKWYPMDVWVAEIIGSEPVVIKSEGCFCKRCGDFFPYAVPNMKDGTLKCYSCRQVWSPE